MLYKSKLLTLENYGVQLMFIDEYCRMGPSGRFYSCICLMIGVGTVFVFG